MQSICFELKKTFKYANGTGAEVECSFIELKEPSGQVSHLCCDIESMLQSAILKMSENLGTDVVEEAKEQAIKDKAKTEADGESEEAEEKDGEAMLALMLSSGVDMKKMVLHFKELFKSVAYMGGEKRMTSARLDDMSHKDFRRMMGVYAANFIMN